MVDYDIRYEMIAKVYFKLSKGAEKGIHCISNCGGCVYNKSTVLCKLVYAQTIMSGVATVGSSLRK